MKSKLTSILIVLATMAGAGLAHAAEQVNVYSARKEYLIKPALDRFSDKTGIEVKLITADAGPLLKRLQSEGRNSPADVFITTDAGRLHQAKVAGVLQPIESSKLDEAIPAAYRDKDGYWFGLSLRARPIMYVKGRVDPSELGTYEDLASPKWKGRICIRSSSNIYNQSLVASMIASHGEEKTLEWLRGFVDNFARPPKGGDRDQIKAAVAGECDIAIANNYYLMYMLGSGDEESRKIAEQVGIHWPNQNGRGTHVNVSGAGVARHAPNKENAVALLEFLVSDEIQQWYAEVNNEYPVKPGVAASSLLKSFGDFKQDSLNLSRLGELNASAVKLMDRAGWK